MSKELDDCQCSDCLAWDDYMRDERQDKAIEDKVDQLLGSRVDFRHALAKIGAAREDELCEALRTMLDTQNGGAAIKFLFQALRDFARQELESEAGRLSG